MPHHIVRTSAWKEWLFAKSIKIFYFDIKVFCFQFQYPEPRSSAEIYHDVRQSGDIIWVLMCNFSSMPKDLLRHFIKVYVYPLDYPLLLLVAKMFHVLSEHDRMEKYVVFPFQGALHFDV